jgi:hypothetical protein
MAYEVAPTPVPGRSGRTVVAIGLVASMMGAGLLAGLFTLAGPAPVQPSTAVPSTGVPDVTCHDLAGSRCEDVAEAALGAVVGPMFGSVRSVGVWATLLCGDTLDCPNGRLADATVAGSAVIDLVDDGTVWVNVTRLGPGRYDAWVVRSRSRG